MTRTDHGTINYKDYQLALTSVVAAARGATVTLRATTRPPPDGPAAPAAANLALHFLADALARNNYHVDRIDVPFPPGSPTAGATGHPAADPGAGITLTVASGVPLRLAVADLQDIVREQNAVAHRGRPVNDVYRQNQR